MTTIKLLVLLLAAFLYPIPSITPAPGNSQNSDPDDAGGQGESSGVIPNFEHTVCGSFSNLQEHSERPADICISDDLPNIDKLKQLRFVGWHGTIVKHIDSLHKQIQVIEFNKEKSEHRATDLKHGLLNTRYIF
ncbi:hypothetical protein BKA69DRAFT_1040325 [Paraphysoderma sedebokerense]|nr:hypothetical protein BKA69DRAFT_1040325 [Paraphysoderma sedebokerense]